MAKWIVDTAHSEVHFKIRHLVISTVTGSFKKFEGEAESEKEDFTDVKASFSIDADSIDTNQPQRDAHLKSPDFFDAANHPKITFTSIGITKKGDGDYILKGDLTIKDVTHPIELDVEYGGITKDPYGQIKIGFDVTGKINRHNFGLKWSAVTEAGGLVVSDDVKMIVSAQFIKQV